MSWYQVVLRMRCEQAIWVEAGDPKEAMRKVNDGDYEDSTDWEPVARAKMSLHNIERVPKPDFITPLYQTEEL